MQSTQKIEKRGSRSTCEQSSLRKSRNWVSAPSLRSSITARSSSTRLAPATQYTTGHRFGSLSETRSWAMKRRILSIWRLRSAASTHEFRARLRSSERRRPNRMCWITMELKSTSKGSWSLSCRESRERSSLSEERLRAAMTWGRDITREGELPFHLFSSQAKTLMWEHCRRFSRTLRLEMWAMRNSDKLVWMSSISSMLQERFKVIRNLGIRGSRSPQ